MKVYVMLGFHTSFHHSWRDDTTDEAGFGTDIHVVRQILRLLAQTEARRLQARGYRDLDVYWTLEQIIPHHASGILDGIRQRVQAGRDEIVLGPYNNGANHAATERELRTAIAYAFENPHLMTLWDRTHERLYVHGTADQGTLRRGHSARSDAAPWHRRGPDPSAGWL